MGFSVEQKTVKPAPGKPAPVKPAPVKPAPGKPAPGTMRLKNSRRATPVDPQSTNSKEPVALRLS
jgi:hypothetical protein